MILQHFKALLKKISIPVETGTGQSDIKKICLNQLQWPLDDHIMNVGASLVEQNHTDMYFSS
jgi:hypothetical protein